jgi:hypothetical protein
VGRGSAGQPGAGREPSGAKGAAGTAITAASETLRSDAAVTNALTNTAGVTASVGFSKSKSTTATQEQAVAGSSVAGGTVNVTATGSDINVRGSAITSSGTTTLTAARDVILESAANTLATQSESSSVGGGISFTVAVGIAGIRGTPSAGISGSKSSSSSNDVTQANTSVTAGGTLNLTTGRYATLKGATAEGKNIVATIGRDLSVESVQDTATATSKSVGGSLSFSGKSLNGKGLADAVGIGRTGLADNATADSNSGTVGSAGVSASVSFSKSKSNANIVEEQSAIVARGGSLAATVTGNTNLHRRRHRRPVRHLRHRESALEVSRHIPVSPRRRNRVTEDLAVRCSNALGGFVTAPHFDGAKNGKQFVGRNIGNRAASKRGIGKAQQPAIFLERDRRQVFAFDLCEPFVGHRLKCIGSGNRRGDLVELGLFRRINSFGEQAPCLVSLGSCVNQFDFGPHAERHCLVFSEMAVIHPPVSRTGRQNEQMQPVRIGQLLLLGAAFSRLDRHRRQSHEGISSNRISEIPSNIPPD